LQEEESKQAKTDHNIEQISKETEDERKIVSDLTLLAKDEDCKVQKEE